MEDAEVGILGVLGAIPRPVATRAEVVEPYLLYERGREEFFLSSKESHIK